MSGYKTTEQPSMTKKQETLVYEKDGLQIVIKTDKDDNRIWIFKTIIQNLFTKRNIDIEGEL